MSAFVFEKLHEQIAALSHLRHSRETSKETETRNEQLPEKPLAMEEAEADNAGGKNGEENGDEMEGDESCSEEEVSHSKSGSHSTHSSIEDKIDIFVHFEILRARQHKVRPFSIRLFLKRFID